MAAALPLATRTTASASCARAPRFWSHPDSVRAVPLCAQLKALLNALYFGADHVVWASQAGLTTNKALVDRAQKVPICRQIWECLVQMMLALHAAPGAGAEDFMSSRRFAVVGAGTMQRRTSLVTEWKCLGVTRLPRRCRCTPG